MSNIRQDCQGRITKSNLTKEGFIISRLWCESERYNKKAVSDITDVKVILGTNNLLI